MVNIEDIWDLYVKRVTGSSTSPENPPFGNHHIIGNGYECLACGKQIIPMHSKGMGNASGRMRSHVEAHVRRNEMPRQQNWCVVAGGDK